MQWRHAVASYVRAGLEEKNTRKSEKGLKRKSKLASVASNLCNAWLKN